MRSQPSTARRRWSSHSTDTVTCPFWRAYGAKDLYKAAGSIPTLHVYIREAQPKDEFDATPNGKGPLSLAREHNKHQTIRARRQSAQEALGFIQKWEPDAVMFVDGMDDALEAMYEARPWRQYVIEAETGVVVDAIGLTPFNEHGGEARRGFKGGDEGGLKPGRVLRGARGRAARYICSKIYSRAHFHRPPRVVARGAKI